MLPPGIVFKQGEHMLLCGGTGCGKTTVASELLADRKYVVMLRTKPRDLSYKKMRLKDTHTWPAPWHAGTRLMLWPKKIPDIDITIARQEALFKRLFNRISQDTGWTVYCDETLYLTDYLGLSRHIAVNHEQGRSAGITMVLATQRPARIPLLAYSGTTHYFIWQTTFEDDLKRLSALGGALPIGVKGLAAQITRLKKHDYVYVNPSTHTAILVKGRV
jgi:hypothetical protein